MAYKNQMRPLPDKFEQMPLHPDDCVELMGSTWSPIRYF